MEYPFLRSRCRSRAVSVGKANRAKVIAEDCGARSNATFIEILLLVLTSEYRFSPLVTWRSLFSLLVSRELSLYDSHCSLYFSLRLRPIHAYVDHWSPNSAKAFAINNETFMRSTYTYMLIVTTLMFYRRGNLTLHGTCKYNWAYIFYLNLIYIYVSFTNDR